jgi:hypothetical protein
MVQRIPTRTPGVYKVHRGKGTVYVARWREVDPITGKARVRDKSFPTEAAPGSTGPASSTPRPPAPTSIRRPDG